MNYTTDESAAKQGEAYRQLHYERPAGATDILLVRHGESAALSAGAEYAEVDGRADPPLSPLGLEQAERVGERLSFEPVDAIYVSPLGRTAQTAAPLAKRLGIEPIVDPDLIEVHLGEWEGGAFRKMLVDQHPLVERLWAEERWDVIPGAEPAEAFAARVRAALSRIAAAHRGQTVAVFAHGGIVAQALSDAASSRPFAFVDTNTASISQIVVLEDRWTVRRYNETTHLSQEVRVVADPPI